MKWSGSLIFFAALCLVLIEAHYSDPNATNQFWVGDVKENMVKMQSGSYYPMHEFNSFVNHIFLPDSFINTLYEKLGENAGFYAACYSRNLIASTMVYWITAGIWSFFEFIVFYKQNFVDKKRPVQPKSIMYDQIMLAQSSIFMYAGLPVFSTFLIENNLTKVYFYVDEVGGWPMYFFYLLCYFVFFEIGIYWVHRKLHTVKFLYKYVHSLHHKYKSADDMTPWCSIAFNPIDGIAQASPYVIGLFFIPVHYYTHVGLVFFSGIWATNIHDGLWGDTEPIMGSKYHLLHHTHYHYNYGQFFIFCDYIFGTLRAPEKSLLNPVPCEYDNDGNRVEKVEESSPVKGKKKHT